MAPKKNTPDCREIVQLSRRNVSTSSSEFAFIPKPIWDSVVIGYSDESSLRIRTIYEPSSNSAPLVNPAAPDAPRFGPSVPQRGANRNPERGPPPLHPFSSAALHLESVA